MINGTNGTSANYGNITKIDKYNQYLNNIGIGGFSSTSDVDHNAANGLIIIEWNTKLQNLTNQNSNILLTYLPSYTNIENITDGLILLEIKIFKHI